MGRKGAAEARQETAVRRLAELASLLERRSPVGKCLRRSLLRYHYLRRVGVPLELRLGARTSDGVDALPDRRLEAHAWVTLNGEPYHEAARNVEGYTVVYEWPRQAPEREKDPARTGGGFEE